MGHDIRELQHRALQIANQYDEYNRVKGQDQWDFQDYVVGLVGDVGDLTKLAMASANKRGDKNDLGAKIEHELNDVLWSVLILYYLHDRTNISESFMDAMDSLEEHILAMKEAAETA